MADIIITGLASVALASLTFFLVWINWRIFKISERILEVSVELLAETVVIRIETVKVRKVSEAVLSETRKMRKALGEVEEKPQMRLTDFE